MDLNLVLFKSNGQRKDFPITHPKATIGRGEDCSLQVPLANVSRKHCELAVGGETVTVKDLASANGTYVNNKRVTEATLAAGDRLVVGPVVFTVQIDGQPEEINPVKTRGQLLAEEGVPGAEEIVDLEADIIANDEIVDLDAAAGAEEVDPIAALEALAAESDEEEDK